MEEFVTKLDNALKDITQEVLTQDEWKDSTDRSMNATKQNEVTIT